jgi:catechol-2,3-dioxygenase
MPAGIREMVLESTDAEGMVAFYERLGLEVIGREPGRVWLDAGEASRIGIWTNGEKEHRDRGGSHFHFALSVPPRELDTMVEALATAGLDFEGPVVHDGGDRSIYFFDPESNRVELWDIHRLPGVPATRRRVPGSHGNREAESSRP